MFIIYLVILLVPLADSIIRGEDFYKGDQVFRLVPKTKEQVKAILQVRKTPGLRELDAWMPTFRPNHPADFYVKRNENADFKKFLRVNNISFRYLVSNVTKAMLKQRPLRNELTKEKYDYEQYQPLEKIHEEMKNLTAKYKDRAKLINLGKSYENRTMWAIQIIGRKKKKNRKMFFIDCGTHAREWISPATCMWFIREMIMHKKSHKMCHKIDWVIIPVLNVDGYAYTWKEKGRFWRKNRKPNNGSKCIGTDLNRNWAYKWGEPGSNSNPCASYYRGASPFSEIEARNVAKYLYKNRCSLLGYIGFHSYSQFWMTPWGYKKDHPEHYSEMKRVADVAVKAIKNSGQGTKYEEPGPSSEIIYRNFGSAKDWTYANLGAQYSYGVELRPHFNGKYGFLIPPSHIKKSGKEILHALFAISQEVTLHPGRRELNQAHHKAHDGHTAH